MFCINCAQDLPDQAKFCSQCGLRVEPRTGQAPSLPVLYEPNLKQDIAPQEQVAVPADWEMPQAEIEDASFTAIESHPSTEELLSTLLKKAEELLPKADYAPTEYLAQVFEICNKALSIAHEHAELHIIKGDALLIAQRFAEAIPEYDKAIRLGSSEASIYNVKAYAIAQKALLLQKLHPEDDTWLTLCDEAVHLNPDLRLTYCDYGNARKSPQVTREMFRRLDWVGANPLRDGAERYKNALQEHNRELEEIEKLDEPYKTRRLDAMKDIINYRLKW